MRAAIIVGGADSLDQVQRYMPGNYVAKFATAQTNEGPQTIIVIVGEDVAGWTLDDYVIPRLASGLIFAQEVAPAEPF